VRAQLENLDSSDKTLQLRVIYKAVEGRESNDEAWID
jgi:hypothetical protein